MTLTSEYAVRALVHLARHRASWPITGRQIAEEASIPPKYLSKILGDLVRHGVLESSPGKAGGFRLRRAASETTLHEVLAPFEPFDGRRCPFGNIQCSPENPCPVHDSWEQVIEMEAAFLRNTTIQDVIRGKD